jgi:D-threo-aldose 1-dehydrogenase
MRSPAEVARNLALAARPVPKELWAELVGEGLLRPDAPTLVEAADGTAG